jgi:CheY-like chemotaxis protein
MLMELDDHVVEAASAGPEALAKLDAFAPDVVLVDIGLPGMNGYDVARAIRARPGGGAERLVALTGYGQQDDLDRAREAGFDHHLTKPVDYGKLSALLAGETARAVTSAPGHA